MKLKRNLIWVALAAVLLAALAWAFAPRPLPVETATVAQGRFEQAIEEDGRTRLRDRYTVSAPVAARLARITLREGDPVASGDTVALLTPVMSSMVDERGAREAAARLRGAGAGVERAAARIERAAVTLQEARLELQRTERLAADGFVAASRLDTARLALISAQRELDMARAEREVAAQEQAQAAAILQPVAAGGGNARPLAVRAPTSGVVLRIAQISEATIAAGTALLDIGDRQRMEVLAELLTTDAVQATPGSRVVIGRWGGPELEGRVRRVEPAAFTKVSALGIEEQRVNVLIDIVTPPEAWNTLGDGFRVGVRIVTASIEQAVLVPVGALFPHAEGMAVYKLEDGRARLQPVEVAGRNPTQAWIRSNLAPGQTLIVYPAAGVNDGSRVRLRKG